MSSFDIPSRRIPGLAFEAALREIRQECAVKRREGAARNFEAMKAKAQERQARLLREAEWAARKAQISAFLVVGVSSVLTAFQISLPLIG